MKHLTENVEEIRKDIQDIHVKMNKHAKKSESIGVTMKKMGDITTLHADGSKIDTIMGQKV
jgi:hypothetical protein